MHRKNNPCCKHYPIWKVGLGVLTSALLTISTTWADNFDKAFSWNLHLSLEGLENFSGGIAPGAVGNATGRAGFAFNTAHAGWWNGGRLVTEFLAIQNGNPENYVGDTQGVNAFTGLNRGALYKLYYRQNVGRATLRAGLISANDYFDATGVASDFLNVSYGFGAAMGINVPGASSYPFSSLGVMGSYSADGWTGMVGIFAGDAIHPFQNPTHQGNMIWLEADQTGSLGGGKYIVKVGGWRNSQLPQYRTRLGNDTNGFYTTGEYRWKQDDIDWGSFLELEAAPNPLNILPWYMGAGLRLRHFWAIRPGDSVGLGMARAWLRGASFDAETDFEGYYSARLFPRWYLQADLQYVVHPSARYPNAIVGILRLHTRFS
ncbi:carbohydrate porin (plasmid) [Acidithiobacillus ferrianus]|uniref:Carbohydrate porin n=2 Tax=Acidithiobacillus ferrianus TaxID=2678518 RepID=A0A845U757_9PROT|nr:carbohydrate porin [Acidithiobacillus ferrianus]NDU41661.1 carbohydrate porin [Acidithiobacillus ferrianus]